MTQNKVNSTVVKNPNNVVAAARAAEEAKSVSNGSVGTPSVEAKQPVEATKGVGTPSVEAKAKPSKRKTAKEWDSILEEMDRDNLSASEIASKYNVTESNVYQWRSKRKANLEQQQTANLSSNSLVEDAKKLLAGIDDELKAFDASIEEAKAKVANAKDERAKIEAKTKKYQTIIDLLGEAEKAKK